MELLQHYWWAIIALLGALLVFLLFVQGGQSLLPRLGKTPEDRRLMVNTLGHKWEFTFTTLVTFGGAFFASFPLFYSTSFGGAVYLWTAILLLFVVQAVGYEFRSKAGNLLGRSTYDAFLMLNGALGPFLLGVAVSGLFFGAPFEVEPARLSYGGAISVWHSPWRGFEALANPQSLLFGATVLLLARVLGLLYFVNTIGDADFVQRCRKRLVGEGILFVGLFLALAAVIALHPGVEVAPDGSMSWQPAQYLHNMIEMPLVGAGFLLGVLAVLAGLWLGIFTRSASGVWYAGAGTILTVWTLLLAAGWNNTAYYPSTVEVADSLTIANSSSSEFTLTAMTWVSALIPGVAAYIWWAWRAMNRRPMTRRELEDDEHTY